MLDLIARRMSRDDATGWAMQWVAAASSDVRDPVVWSALNNLSGADAG